jgi:hypothetical protein
MTAGNRAGSRAGRPGRTFRRQVRC